MIPPSPTIGAGASSPRRRYTARSLVPVIFVGSPKSFHTRFDPTLGRGSFRFSRGKVTVSRSFEKSDSVWIPCIFAIAILRKRDTVIYMRRAIEKEYLLFECLLGKRLVDEFRFPRLELKMNVVDLLLWERQEGVSTEVLAIDRPANESSSKLELHPPRRLKLESSRRRRVILLRSPKLSSIGCDLVGECLA